MLTTERLAEFIGGDMEIQSDSQGCIFRGLIENAVGEDNAVKGRFRWLAKNGGGHGLPSATWTNHDNLEYEASLDIYQASDIGSGRICLLSSMVGELVMLFPPNGSHLDPARVKGLTLS